MKCDNGKWSYDDVTLESFSNTANDSIGQLKYALMSGPVTVAIVVTEKMMFYAGGVFDDDECVDNDYNALGHQVTAVGWGYDAELDKEYWIIKNSWSNAWGIDGYINIAFNHCGVLLSTTVPNLVANK